jgi:Rod binding domain-containing protein
MDALKAKQSLAALAANQPLTPLKAHAKGGPDDMDRLEGACRDFESLFLSHMLKEMRTTIPKSGFMDGGHAEELFTSMLDGELAQKIAQHGGIGLTQNLRDYVQNLYKKGAG